MNVYYTTIHLIRSRGLIYPTMNQQTRTLLFSANIEGCQRNTFQSTKEQHSNVYTGKFVKPMKKLLFEIKNPLCMCFAYKGYLTHTFYA